MMMSDLTGLSQAALSKIIADQQKRIGEQRKEYVILEQKYFELQAQVDGYRKDYALVVEACETQQARIEELEADKANILANTGKSALRLVNLNKELQAQVKELERKVLWLESNWVNPTGE